MQSLQPRSLSPRPYIHDIDAAGEEGVSEQQRDQGFYQPAYDSSERLGHVTLPSHYGGEQLYDRSNEVPSQMDQEAVFDPTNDSPGASHYRYMGAPAPPSQPHVPSQASHFAMPSSRGTHDVTGQACPPGGRPRVSTTIWEDEGTLCFQVEAKQVTVARREDNNMINGTKLLNVAQMSRGKRDGILKNEAIRSVIKVGSMHLKGVWIPFERALELANKYHVTDMLYPLFVNDIKKFLYHPANYARTTAVLAAANQRQAQQGQPGGGDGPQDDRPALDRSLPMPTPLDRSLSMLTPPSSASTNGDYWSNHANPNVPLSEAHARSHSLPGTPATTPPAPGYFRGLQHQQPYMGAFTEPRPPASSNHYGQQPDMQRSYQHSRNTSLMSYQDEDMSNGSSSHSLPPEPYVVMQPNSHAHLQPPQLHDPGRYNPQANYHSRSDRNSPYAIDSQLLGPGSSGPPSKGDHRMGSATPGHSRSHSRTQSKGSLKVFNTPNLTTQMSRRVMRTPNGSPARGHARQSSRDVSSQNTQASIWVQSQQQLAYNTPQPTSRGHHRQMSGQLPQIYEETPSCRMAYQLHGPGRLPDQYGTFAETEQIFSQPAVSPMRSHYAAEPGASPLTGKKKRDRVISDPDQYFQQQPAPPPFDERQESLTPPPIVKRDDLEESPKRRRSERTGLHSRSGSVY